MKPHYRLASFCLAGAFALTGCGRDIPAPAAPEAFEKGPAQLEEAVELAKLTKRYTLERRDGEISESNLFKNYSVERELPGGGYREVRFHDRAPYGNFGPEDMLCIKEWGRKTTFNALFCDAGLDGFESELKPWEYAIMQPQRTPEYSHDSRDATRQAVPAAQVNEDYLALIEESGYGILYLPRTDRE